MIFGCCTSINYYDAVVKAGYDAITLSGVDITSYTEEEFLKAKKTIKEGPLKALSINSFCPGSLRFHGPGYDNNKIALYTESLCIRGSQMGFKYIGIGSPVSKMLLDGENEEEAKKEFDEALKTMCEVAAKYNMEILMESITKLDTNFYNTTRECYALVKRLNISNLHLVYDIYHEWCENEGPKVIKDVYDEIKVVHLSNLERGKRTYLKKEDKDLYKSYYDELKKAGFNLEFNAECFEDNPEQKMAESLQIIKSLN